MTSSLSGAAARHAMVTALLATTMACAHNGVAAHDQATESRETTAMSDASNAMIEGDGVRIEAAFEAGGSGPLRVRYRVHNTGSADIAVFDRGNRHAVLTRRQRTGEVGEPGFREEGDGDVTVSHVALPLSQPSPTVPPVPLAAKLGAGQSLEGEFTFSPLVGEPPRRLRWCLGVVPFDEEHFSTPEQAEGVEVWQASFELADRQQTLCTPWFEIAAGAFAVD